MSFNYDGLGRQVSRTTSQGTTYNVWDGWNLIEEYQAGGTPTAYYLYGADGLILDSQVGNADFNWYYQDGSGSTSHLASSSGTLLEWYRYDLKGTPIIYDANNNQRTASAYNVRHLFTGQQWYQELGLYDLRNRFYSPDIGRFLQPDPIGFRDGNNLYRYCGNNPVTRWDPFGLLDYRNDGNGRGGTAVAERVTVTGSDPNDRGGTGGGTGAPGGGGGGGGGGEGSGPSGRGGRGQRRGVLHVDYGAGNPAYQGSGTEEDPSNWNTTGDPGVYVNWHTGPASNQTIPGAVFYGTSPGGSGSPYLFVVNPNKIIVPVTRQFASYNLKSFANVMDYGVAYPAAIAVAVPVLGPAGMAGVRAAPTAARWAGPIAATLLRLAEIGREEAGTAIEDEPVPAIEEPVPSGPGTRPANPAGWPTPAPGL